MLYRKKDCDVKNLVNVNFSFYWPCDYALNFYCT